MYLIKDTYKDSYYDDMIDNYGELSIISKCQVLHTFCNRLQRVHYTMCSTHTNRFYDDANTIIGSLTSIHKARLGAFFARGGWKGWLEKMHVNVRIFLLFTKIKHVDGWVKFCQKLMQLIC